MVTRKIAKTVTGQQAVDGAGVHLVRVLGHDTTKDFDPFLMLDSFDSKNPKDYIKGFPTHPHRGIETITYLIQGEMEHQDSLGNSGTIHAGEGQWMTAGSGILHQEMPKAAKHMLGFQLWLNLPKRDKMTPPAYYDISKDHIASVQTDSGIVRVISGEYEGNKGAEPKYLQATIYDVIVEQGKEISITTKEDETVFVFTIDGDAVIDSSHIVSKTAVLFGSGDRINVKAPEHADCRFIFYSAKPLKEPIAWGGPVVMNTQEELQQTFDALRKGTFIQSGSVKHWG